MGSRSLAHRFYVMDTDTPISYWGPTSLSSTPRFYPSPCKHPTPSKWTTVTDGKSYLWSSLSTRLAT